MIRAAILLFLFACNELLTAAPAKQLTGAYAPAAHAALPPSDSQKAFTVPPGFEVRLFASEPDIINPVAMTWDERGRLWVVELFEYPLGAPKGVKPRDRIKILEDTDGDGRADKVTIFADGLNLATGIALGNGGVYVGQAPDLLFLRDTNHDDHADTREVLLTGFDTNDRHELLNGFTWGPDGWLYMTHGVFNHSKVHRPSSSSSSSSSSSNSSPHTFEASEPGVEVSAALCRYHPITKKFEAFADGTSNPWGVDFDAAGNAFVSACVIDHLFHLAAGGIYQRQGGVPENPYSYELLPSIVDHKHYMAAYSGICIYQGDMFPPEYQGHVFFGNIHQCAINHDRLIPNGSSFKAVAEKDFLTTTDGWFRPVSEQVGPDGAMWIADWYDKYPCYQNAQADPEGVDRTYGRIWRVVYTNAQPAGPTDLSKLSRPELVKLLDHPNVWQRRTAQRILAETAEKRPIMTDQYGLGIYDAAENELLDLFEHGKTARARLNAFRTLHQIGSVARYETKNSQIESGPDFIAKALESEDATMRIWALRFAPTTLKNLVRAATSYRTAPSASVAQSRAESIMSTIETLASDNNPSVRLAVATAMRQIVSGALTIDTDVHTPPEVGKVLVELIQASADAKDPLLPFMIWMASEPLVAKNPEGGLKWLAENGARNMPLTGILARKAMRRICDTSDVNKLNQAVDYLEQIADDKSGLADATLDGLIEAQKTKLFTPTRETKSLFAALAANSDKTVQFRAHELGSLWNDPESIAATLKLINDQSAPTEARIKAIEVSKEKKTQGIREALLEAITAQNPDAVIIEALRGISAVGGTDDVAAQILNRWPSFNAEVRRAAIDTLVSRQRWANDFLNAVENKTISPSEISANVFRSLGHFKDPKIDERAKALLGRFRESSADKVKLIKQKRHMVLLEEPDINHGHEVAKKTCFVCHKLYGEGADVGPDLTGVGRSSLDALLNNVIDPNQVVGKGYENVEVETKDGRSVSGRMVENDATHVKLVSAGPKEETIAKSDIESLRVSQLSVMPEGLEQMPDKDFRDLIWYILDPPGDNRPLTKELKKQLSNQK